MTVICRTIAIIAMMLMASIAHAQQTQSGIATEITTKLPSGEPGGIPAVDLRQVLTDMNSAIFQAQGGSGLVLSGTPSAGQSIVATDATHATWGTPGGLAPIGANSVLGSLAGGVPSALNSTQLTTLCNIFTSSLSGCVPSSGGGVTNFLRADNTWAPVSFSANSTVVATPAALAAAVIPGTVNYVYVTAMSGTTPTAAIKSNCGLMFVRGTSTPTSIYGEILNSGIYWEPMYSTSPVRACEFGAIGDGTFSQSNNATCLPTCTDNIVQIQAAINYALVNRFGTVCLNDGSYATSDTIQLGWGTVFAKIELAACTGGRAPLIAELDGTAAGVAILPSKVDRCAINIQTTRNAGIRGITIDGQNFSYASTIVDRMQGVTGNTPTPTTAAGWLNPTLVPAGGQPGGLTNKTPYAAICIDAFSGGTPSPAYPTKTYPSGPYFSPCPGDTCLNPGSQYVSGSSSNTIIDNVQVSGFAIMIASEPNGPNQGDFLSITNSACFFTAICVAVGNSQARNMQINNFTFNGVHTVANDYSIGVNNGQFGGPFSNISGSASYQIFDLRNLANGYPIQINNTYSENQVRVGVFGGSAAFNTSVQFNGCNILFYPTLNLVSPRAYVESFGTGTAFTFNGCALGAGARIDNLIAGGASVLMNGGIFHGGNNIAMLNSAAIARAVNYTGSVLIGGASTAAGTLSWLNGTQATYVLSTPGDTQPIVSGTYTPGTGIVSLTLTSAHGRSPGDQIIINAATGTGSFAAINGTFTAISASGTTLTYQIPIGLTMTITGATYIDPGTQGGIGIGNNVSFYPSTRGQFTQATTGFIDILNNKQWKFRSGPSGYLTDLSDTVNYVTVAANFTSCDTIAFTYRGFQQNSPAVQPSTIVLGDILLQADYTIYVVTGVGLVDGGGNYPMVARQMNNMIIDLNGNCVTSNATTSGGTIPGNTKLIHTGVLNIPNNVLFGDTNSASTTVANVQQGSGFGANATAFLSAWPANNIVSGTWAAGVATIGTTTAHGVPVNTSIRITGTTPAGYSGNFITLPGTAGSTLKVQVAASLANWSSGGSLNAGGDTFWSYPVDDPGYNWPWPVGGNIVTVSNNPTGGCPGGTGCITLSSPPLSLGTVGSPTTTGRFPILPLPVQ